MLQKLRAWLNGLSDRVINEQDSEQDKLNKTLLIFACGLMGFGSILWLALYWAMGIKFSSTVPLTYLAVSALSLGYYVYTLNYAVFRTTQVSLFLFMPFIMQWSIGSYVSSSGVALWALLAPVGVMIFQGAKQSLPWYAAYIVMTAISGFFDFWLNLILLQTFNVATFVFPCVELLPGLFYKRMRKVFDVIRTICNARNFIEMTFVLQ